MIPSQQSIPKSAKVEPQGARQQLAPPKSLCQSCRHMYHGMYSGPSGGFLTISDTILDIKTPCFASDPRVSPAFEVPSDPCPCARAPEEASAHRSEPGSAEAMGAGTRATPLQICISICVYIYMYISLSLYYYICMGICICHMSVCV